MTHLCLRHRCSQHLVMYILEVKIKVYYVVTSSNKLEMQQHHFSGICPDYHLMQTEYYKQKWNWHFLLCRS